MAQSDWHFGGESTTVGNYRWESIAYNLGLANGGGAVYTNGGHASLGQGELNSGLANPLTTGGDYARAIVAHVNAGTTSASRDWAGMNLLKDAAVAGYPITTTPASGTLVAQSVRGFLRIGCLAGSETNGTPGQSGTGTAVGLIAKGYTVGAPDFNGGLGDHIMNFYWGWAFGYTVMLSSANHAFLDPAYSGSADSGPGAVRLIVGSSTDPDAGGAADEHTHVVCSGTYLYNTWYRVRMDVEPNVSGDTINVYTAPITDAVGSEVWTLVGTNVISAASNAYIPWDDTNANQVGWWWGGRSAIASATQSLHDAFLDRWQFFWKDVS